MQFLKNAPLRPANRKYPKVGPILTQVYAKYQPRRSQAKRINLHFAGYINYTKKCVFASRPLAVHVGASGVALCAGTFPSPFQNCAWLSYWSNGCGTCNQSVPPKNVFFVNGP